MKTAIRIDRLAGLFAYPTDGLAHEVDVALEVLETLEQRHADALLPLVEVLRDRPVEEIEELYTRTFDINPACSLEIGWHLFGEDYARGAFMVRVREALRRSGVEESAELPDHLTHVLPLIVALEEEEATELATRFVLPSMDKMLEGFADTANPWRPALVMIRDVLVEQYGPSQGAEAADATGTSPYGLPDMSRPGMEQQPPLQQLEGLPPKPTEADPRDRGEE